MKSPTRLCSKTRSSRYHGLKTTSFVDQANSSPELAVVEKTDLSVSLTSPREICSASDTILSARKDGNKESINLKKQINAKSGDQGLTSMEPTEDVHNLAKIFQQQEPVGISMKQVTGKEDKGKCYTRHTLKKLEYHSPLNSENDESIARQISDIHHDTRKSARIIRDSRARLLELQKKQSYNEKDIKEIAERNELLLREMERFDRLTKVLQRLVGTEPSVPRKPKNVYQQKSHIPIQHDMKMNHPTILLAGSPSQPPHFIACDQPTRSKSEIDLTRKLSESYDMQEKLVADNADLEVKRYILYKELMTKDQNLETCRAQIKRLQGELKYMSKENSMLHEKLSKNNPKGDASAMSRNRNLHKEFEVNDKVQNSSDAKKVQDLLSQIECYKKSTVELEKQLGGLEIEVHHIRIEMDQVKKAAGSESACRGSGGGAGPNTCHQQSVNRPPPPPLTKACGVCPPCPAPCNPDAPPTPAEREVAKLTIQLRQTEENFKTKVTECAMLRAELLKKKEALEKERCQNREIQNKLRELEMKFEGVTTQTNMALGTFEQAFEQEVNVRALKRCYREAREEVDELRTLLKEQNEQIQDYRVKYLQAQQLVEEQRRQMDLMDMDNTRISEQINLEIQKVKIKFQEKLQELAPIPDLLKATQMRLKDAQQAQAIAEHNAEQLARELNCAREKVHVLLHNSMRPPEKMADKGAEEKQINMLQQRITQLTEMNQSLKNEIERLKANVIRMEEAVLANEKRLQEKMHECAQLGGELDRARDEAARALQRANERTETAKKCLQTTVAELERQLAASRAQVATAEKDRKELQCRMQCQITRLGENFEQAQMRILGLKTQVQSLRQANESTDDGESDGQGDQLQCSCKEVFQNP